MKNFLDSQFPVLFLIFLTFFYIYIFASTKYSVYELNNHAKYTNELTVINNKNILYYNLSDLCKSLWWIPDSKFFWHYTLNSYKCEFKELSSLWNSTLTFNELNLLTSNYE